MLIFFKTAHYFGGHIWPTNPTVLDISAQITPSIDFGHKNLAFGQLQSQRFYL